MTHTKTTPRIKHDILHTVGAIVTVSLMTHTETTPRIKYYILHTVGAIVTMSTS